MCCLPGTAMIELYTADPSGFAGLSVDFEIRRQGADARLTRATARVGTTELPGRRIAQATLDTGELTPGDYMVSAIVRVNGAPVGRVSRAVQIAP
jgi:hypothetical protein